MARWKPLTLAALVAGACLTSPRLPETVAEGTWGGDDAGLIVRNDGAHAHIGCTLGDAPVPIPLDGDGRFDVAAEWNVNAFPIDLGIVHPARITGSTDGHRLTFTVVLTDTGQTLGPVLVTFGREPRMQNCPICRIPDRKPEHGT
jgi:hypothetical protein